MVQRVGSEGGSGVDGTFSSLGFFVRGGVLHALDVGCFGAVAFLRRESCLAIVRGHGSGCHGESAESEEVSTGPAVEKTRLGSWETRPCSQECWELTRRGSEDRVRRGLGLGGGCGVLGRERVRNVGECEVSAWSV